MPRRPRSARPFCRAALIPVLALGALPLLAGCRGLEVKGGGSEPSATASRSDSASASPSGPQSPDPAGHPDAASPFDNPRGLRRGLAPLTSSHDRQRARTLIGTVHTKGRGPRTGYERDAFGYAWKDSVDGVPLAHNGCDTRNDVLARDGRALQRRAGSDCVVASMTLHDPYTGRTIEWRKQDAIEVQIDHVMPLSYDWQMGAAHWNEKQRERIANDPLNLIPVDGPSNSAKGDSGPASWLPPDKRIRCAYAVRFAQVSLKYALPVTVPDKHAMLAQCRG